MSYALAVGLVITRERLLRHDGGAMAVVSLNAQTILSIIDELDLHLAIAVYNHSTSHVVSGLEHDINHFVTRAKERGARAHKLTVQAGVSNIRASRNRNSI